MSETVILTVNTFASETDSFDLTGRGLESDTVNLKVNTIASETGSFDLTESGLESETVHLKVNTFASLGKSFTNVAPMISPVDAQAAEKLYQLAEIIGVSKTLTGTL